MGNQCMKDGRFTEAIIRYTQSLKSHPSNHLVYSNRSLAFLKEQQYYLAMEDAKKCIKLQPSWAKGYFRKGEIEFQTCHYEAALQSYKYALSLEPSDESIKAAVHKTSNELESSNRADAKLPWTFTVIGALLGLLVVLGDEFTLNPTLSQFLLKIAFVGGCGALGALAARGYRYISDNQRKALLEPPPDLLGDDTIKQGGGERHNSSSTDGNRTTRQRSARHTDI